MKERVRHPRHFLLVFIRPLWFLPLRFLCDPTCFREVSASKKSVFSKFSTGFVVFQSNFFVVSTPAYLGALLKVFLSYFQQVCMLV